MNVIKLFEKIIPSDRIINQSEDILQKYSIDRTKNITAKADAVIFPKSAKEISEILKICNREKIPIIPRSGGTGVTGGAAAIYGGIILSLEKMNRVIEIDPGNMTASVEPGVITSQISKSAEKYSLFYPPDPASLDECMIGGNFAENAGGPRAVKYGTTRDYILGIEFVTADGEIMQHGGKFVKNVSGYDFTSILCGSEGTLAIVTKLWIKLLPKPERTADILIGFDTMQDAVNTVTKILHQKNNPAAIEFMEKEAIELVAEFTNVENMFPECNAQLIVTYDGNTTDNINLKINKLFDIETIKEKNTLIAKDDDMKTKIWQMRRGIKDAIGKKSPVYFAEDCVVPRVEIPVFIKEIKEYLQGLNMSSIFFGHAGDGNVHIDVLKMEMNEDLFFKQKDKISENIYKLALSHGGTITGEHGIGSLRKNFLKMQYSEKQIELMKSIKRTFDPNNILNPGKIIDID